MKTAQNFSIPASGMPAILARYSTVRQQSIALAAPLSEEDCCAQSMPDASPIKWHLAHTTWFFETFILEQIEPDFQPHHPAFRMLFNSYYNGVGDKHLRAQRGLLTRPSLAQVLAYRRDVDARIAHLLHQGATPDVAALVELGIQHEQQHQELMLTDVHHLFSRNPLYPCYAESGAPDVDHLSLAGSGWRDFEAGVVGIGHADDGFCFDNETPRHRQFVERFSLATGLVSNAEFLGFIDAGGYTNPMLWLSEGWDWVQTNQLKHPLYWQQSAGLDSEGNGWHEFTLQGLQVLELQRPVTCLSLFEADAYARWAGARLPTEFEWEHAATLSPHGTLSNLFGVAWQWTSSSYAPYPGYAPAAGTLGEYNGKFMVNQYVLRGSSCLTPEHHTRATYRNFFPATARWQCTGIRLAKS